MNGDRLAERGQELCEELRRERQRAAPRRWQSSAELRAKLVAYAVACRADGKSHQRVADRLGVLQPTLSRWIRKARGQAARVRQVAIVPSSPSLSAAPPAASLRLVSPNGFIGVAPFQWTVNSFRPKLEDGGSFRRTWVNGSRGRSGGGGSCKRPR
jgi:transposase